MKGKLLALGMLFFAILSTVIIIYQQKVSAHLAPFNPKELAIIQEYLLKNITSTENKVVKNDNGKLIYSIPGAVLASPSNREHGFSQDYQFHWVRDAAIAMNEVVYLYAHASLAEKKRLKPYLLNYIQFEEKAQQQLSKQNEKTLGQPKYNIDGTIWEGKWERPQNDGPALRATTMIAIANLFSHEDETTLLNDQLLKLIITDLNYVVAEWKNKTADLWEEVQDQDHFYTKMVQRKALLEGAALLKRLGQYELAQRYIKTATQLTASLQQHWNQSLGYFSETIYQQYYKGGGLNSAILLGVLQGQTSHADHSFALDNERVMSSVYFIRHAFTMLYKINANNHQLPLLGRYPNDIYDGNEFKYGNPWILITNSLAEYYYSLAKVLMAEGQIHITHNNISFFQQVNPRLAEKIGVITLADQPEKFSFITQALIAEGDKILQTVKGHATCYKDQSCLHFAEQIDRASGTQVSAKDLTWGYATFLTAMQAREEVV